MGPRPEIILLTVPAYLFFNCVKTLNCAMGAVVGYLWALEPHRQRHLEQSNQLTGFFPRVTIGDFEGVGLVRGRFASLGPRYNSVAQNS